MVARCAVPSSSRVGHPGRARDGAFAAASLRNDDASALVARCREWEVPGAVVVVVSAGVCKRRRTRCVVGFGFLVCEDAGGGRIPTASAPLLAQRREWNGIGG